MLVTIIVLVTVSVLSCIVSNCVVLNRYHCFVRHSVCFLHHDQIGYTLTKVALSGVAPMHSPPSLIIAIIGI